MTLTPELVAEVANGLTGPQRRLLGEALYTCRWRLPRWSRALSRKGVLPVGNTSTALTPLGLAVRDYLNGEKP